AARVHREPEGRAGGEPVHAQPGGVGRARAVAAAALHLRTALERGRGEHVDGVAPAGLVRRQVLHLALDAPDPRRVAVGDVDDPHGPKPTSAPGDRRRGRHSHSIVPGGLLVTSRTTRLTSGTSLVMRVEIRASTSYGSR